MDALIEKSAPKEACLVEQGEKLDKVLLINTGKAKAVEDTSRTQKGAKGRPAPRMVEATPRSQRSAAASG